MASDREVRRRRVLALTGAAIASLAGCPADQGTETAGRSTTEPATDTPTSTPTDTGTTASTDTETPSPTDTASPTPTPSPNAFADGFADTDLDRYRAVSGSLDPWSVGDQIDGESALVDTTGDGSASLIAPVEEALSWTGAGTVGVDIQFGTDPAFRNCTLVIGDVPGGASSYIQVTPRQLLVSAPDGTVRQRFPEIGTERVHHIDATLGDGTVAVTVDGEYGIEIDVGERLPAGTVAFGIEADRATTGGKTWFDNLDVSV